MNWRPSCSLDALTARARMLADVRAYFAEHDVLEVQTPVLARHGVTDVAIDTIQTRDGRHLGPSPEYLMKRLLAAGTPSIYQIGPAFRRGEAGRWHNPEFTMLEWYRLGFDAQMLMEDVRGLVDRLLQGADYRTITFRDLLIERFGVDETSPELVAIARDRFGASAPSQADAIDLLCADAMQGLTGRVFITDYPAADAALARLRERDGRTVADRFELVIDGVEIANGYHELTDAEELRRRFVRDQHQRNELGKEALAIDEAFLEAHRAGLPDCAGVAVGLDRLFALALGASSISEVLSFAWDRA